MHIRHFLLLSLLSSLLHYSFQVETSDQFEEIIEQQSDASPLFDMQDVLQLFNVQNPLALGEDVDVRFNPLVAHLKDLENTMEISLFTYLSNQIINNSKEETYPDQSTESAVTAATQVICQDAMVESPDTYLKEVEETFQSRNYNTSEQLVESSAVEAVNINEVTHDVVIVDEKITRLLLPLVLSAVDNLESNVSEGSNESKSYDTDSIAGVQGLGLAALKGVYNAEEESDEEPALVFAEIKDSISRADDVYLVGAIFGVIVILSLGVILRRLMARKNEAQVRRVQESQECWYVESRDI